MDPAIKTIRQTVEELQKRTVLSIASGRTTQSGLSRIIRTSQPHLSNWIAGKRGLSIAAADRLSGALSRLEEPEIYPQNEMQKAA